MQILGLQSLHKTFAAAANSMLQAIFLTIKVAHLLMEIQFELENFSPLMVQEM